MKLLNVFVILITWFSCSAVYMIIRTLTLKRSCKASGKKSFLDFYEADYLKKNGKTWRRRYNFIYNSKIYWLFSWGMVVWFLLLVLGLVVALILIQGSDFSSVLQEVVW